MQRDHRMIRLTLPHATDIREKKWTTPRKGDLDKPSDFGILADAAIKANPPTGIAELDRMFSEMAKPMPKATPRKKAPTGPQDQGVD